MKIIKRLTVASIQVLAIVFVSAYVVVFGSAQDLRERSGSSNARDSLDIRRILQFIKAKVGDKLSVNVDIAKYFSRTHLKHPLPELFLAQPLYAVEWFTQFGRIISNQSDNFKNIFYALAKFSSDVKRIDIIENPAEKIFSNPPTEKVKILKGKLTDEELRITAGFSECIRVAKDKFDNFIFQNPEFMVNPITKFSDINALSVLHFKYEKILNFLEVLNTSQYLLLLCFDNLIKNIGTIRNSFVADVGGIAFEVYGKEDDFVVVPNSSAVIINLGGNDTYFFWRWDQDLKPYASSFLVIVDLGKGKDLYKFLGGRSLYVSLIFDDGGDDFYDCTFGCQGGGFFGSEILVDADGNDHYRALGVAQGAGFLGTGILLDLKGDDLYKSITFSQGSAKIGGGLLADFQGNDRYILKKGNEFPSFQDRSRNLSMGQGCGTGIRADHIENYESIGGGVGLLYDFSGNDEYVAEVFSQGCGYWYGIGALIDMAGDDKYTGYWYCQGTSAHFGVGILVDSGGSDSYLCDFQGMGHGHDLGYGILIDFVRDGKVDSDIFTCKERCLGMGHANGIGTFFNWGGYDEYKAEKYAFGDAITNIYSKQESMRDIIPTVGIFIDIGQEYDKLTMGGETFDPETRKTENRGYLYSILIKQDNLE